MVVHLPDHTVAGAAPSVPLWLYKLHSEIWNRQDLKPTLFHKVEVNRTHYDALEDSLNQKYKNRGDKQYDAGSSTVLSEKLAILKTTTPTTAIEAVSPPNPKGRMDVDDGNCDGDGDDPEAINSLFPSTLSFLDLSSILREDKHETSDRFPVLLYLREEYNHISKLIDLNVQDNSGSVIVSGQPGTGKTTYLHLRMIESLISGQQFLYQTTDGIVYHVAEKGVGGITEPRDYIRCPSVQIIIVSSPQGASQKWMKQVGPDLIFTKLATSLWTPRELFLTGIFLHRRDIPFNLLRRSTSYFGYSLRECFTASCSRTRLNMTINEVKERITTVATKRRILEELDSYRIGASEPSHSLFQLFPTKESRLLADCEFEPVSRWVVRSLLEVYETLGADAMALLYRYVSRETRVGSFRDCLFESLVLAYFNQITTNYDLRIRGLTNSNEVTWTYCGHIPPFTFLQDEAAADKINEAVATGKSLHLLPSVSNFPAIDSIILDPDGLTCIQITISDDHPIVVSGLQRVQKWLNRSTPAKLLRPEKTRPWRFIFIVPLNIAHKFKLQAFEGKGKGAWAQKVDQYVFGLKEETIFKIISDLSNWRTINGGDCTNDT